MEPHLSVLLTPTRHADHRQAGPVVLLRNVRATLEITNVAATYRTAVAGALINQAPRREDVGRSGSIALQFLTWAPDGHEWSALMHRYLVPVGGPRGKSGHCGGGDNLPPLPNESRDCLCGLVVGVPGY
jgi:hypothetical protein